MKQRERFASEGAEWRARGPAAAEWCARFKVGRDATTLANRPFIAMIRVRQQMLNDVVAGAREQ